MLKKDFFEAKKRGISCICLLRRPYIYGDQKFTGKKAILITRLCLFFSKCIIITQNPRVREKQYTILGFYVDGVYQKVRKCGHFHSENEWKKSREIVVNNFGRKSLGNITTIDYQEKCINTRQRKKVFGCVITLLKFMCTVKMQMVLDRLNEK